MKKLNKIFFLLLLTVVTFTSCSNEDETVDDVVITEPAADPYSSGLFVVNEGNFSDNNGSITFKSATELKQTLFETVNSRPIAGLVQSMTISGDNAYIVNNAANRIEVVKAGTFEVLSTWETGFTAPRYIEIKDGKAYVSCWGEFEPDYSLKNSYIAVVDITTGTVETTIKTLAGPEGLLIDGNNLYVAAGFAANIEKIDLSSNTVVGNLELAGAPKRFLLDASGKMWTTSSSNVYQIDLGTFSIAKDISTGKVTLGADFDLYNDKAYLLSSLWDGDKGGYVNAVYVMDQTATTFPTSSIVNGEGFYGLDVNPANGSIYVSNAGGFTAAGTVVLYDEAGAELSNFAAGVGPSEVVFID